MMERQGTALGRNAPVSGPHPAANFPAEGTRAERGQGRQRWLQQLALGVLAGLFASGLLLLMQAGPGSGVASTSAEEKSSPLPLFRGWGKPDLAIVLSGQMYGYHQPCGCSHPQYGGLARRYNFLQTLKKKEWPIICLDLGDIAQKSGPQRMLKYEHAMRALTLMEYAAIGVGKNEMQMPLWEALSNYTLNHPTPRVLAANLLNRDKGEVFHGLIHDGEIIRRPGAPEIGVLGLIAPTVAREAVKMDSDLKFHKDNAAVVNRTLAEMKARKVKLAVVLYQGNLAEARACARYCEELHQKDATLPLVQLVVCLSEHEEPPSEPDREYQGLAKIITLGHKGRYVGVVGVFREAGARHYRLEYQLVRIGPEYETPDGQEKGHPIMALMEEYARQVRDGKYLSRYPPAPHPVQVNFPKAYYVGSERCASCHEHEYQVWADSAHRHAYDTLVNAKRPSLRQYDGECVVCHVTGFGYNTGYADGEVTSAPTKQPIKMERLRHVGCESCHGPGSEHIKDTRNKMIHAVMNPFKATPAELDPKTDPKERERLKHARMLNIDLSCQKCHDHDNDVHWNFSKKWPKIVHMSPPRPGQAQPVQLQPAPMTTDSVPLQPQPQVNPPEQPKGLGRFNIFRLFRRPKDNPDE